MHGDASTRRQVADLVRYAAMYQTAEIAQSTTSHHDVVRLFYLRKPHNCLSRIIAFDGEPHGLDAGFAQSLLCRRKDAVAHMLGVKVFRRIADMLNLGEIAKRNGNIAIRHHMEQPNIGHVIGGDRPRNIQGITSRALLAWSEPSNATMKVLVIIGSITSWFDQ